MYFLTKRERDKERKEKIAFLVYRVLKSGCSLVENKNPPLPNPKNTCCNHIKPYFSNRYQFDGYKSFCKTLIQAVGKAGRLFSNADRLNNLRHIYLLPFTLCHSKVFFQSFHYQLLWKLYFPS